MYPRTKKLLNKQLVQKPFSKKQSFSPAKQSNRLRANPESIYYSNLNVLTTICKLSYFS